MVRIARLLAVTACTGVVLAVGSAAAQEVKVINAGPGLDTLRVVRDKDTGRLRAATAEEIEAMTANRRAARFMPNVVVQNRPETTIVNRPDGSATIRRSLDDLDSLTASRTADGKLVVRHNGKDEHAPSTSNLPKE